MSLTGKSRKIHDKNGAEDQRTDDQFMVKINQLWDFAADNWILTEGPKVSAHVVLCRISSKCWVVIKTRILQVTER